MKNPFSILGITPEMCNRLQDEDLFVLVKSAYRALQTIYHPDRGGSHKRAIEVNLAFELLDYRKNQEKFVRYRELYIKRLFRKSRDRARELEAQLEQQKSVCRKTAQHYYDYILNRIGCDERKNSIASLKSMTIGLNDVALQQNLPLALHTYGTNYKQIRINDRGRSFVKEVGSSTYHERKYTRLLGSIPRDAVEILPHLQGYETTPHVPFNLRNEKKLLGYQKPVFKNIILQENFITYCLPHLRPFIRENSYLVSINSKNKSLILDGVIIKITQDGDAV
jgi:curved DNA-binding protein CbpA